MGPKLVFTYWNDEETSIEQPPTFSLDGFAYQILWNKMGMCRITAFHPYYAEGLDITSFKAQEMTAHVITTLAQNQTNELLLVVVPKQKFKIVLYLLQKKLFDNTLDLHDLCTKNQTLQHGLYVSDKERNVEDFFETYCFVPDLECGGLIICPKRYSQNGQQMRQGPHELTSPENLILS